MKLDLPLIILILLSLPVAVTASAQDAEFGGWYGENRARLDQLVQDYGSGSADYDPEKRPIAVFDWDNTVAKNDIGAATVAWVIQHGLVHQPADWASVMPFLTAGAAARLNTLCRFGVVGEPLDTPSSPDCASELLAVYRRAALTDGTPAFAGYNHHTFKPTAAWQSILLAGYSPDEVRQLAEQVIEAHTSAEIGATQTVGHTDGVDAYIRLYPLIHGLITELQTAGFDVWVVSASPQHVVEPFASRVGVAADHAIGIRSEIDPTGRQTTRFQSCTSDDPQDGLITFADGKRCWINRVILGIQGEQAMERAPDGRGPVFVAGDAGTDLTMLRDATALRLVINRNKTDLMCYAYHNEDGNWLVNRMFIEPKPERAQAYSCSVDACTSTEGNGVPCLDESGSTIPDQRDTVF